MINTIFQITEKVLTESGKYSSNDGKLLRNLVLENAEKMDKELLSVLINNEETKNAYFTEVDGIQIFDKVKFGWIIQNKEFLPDSYTRYKNKIGLINSRGEFISTSNDVELVFPYKDCILEGGQTKEDQKNNEIFYNETLAPDQVSNLLAPKAFCNAKKYDKDGVHEVTEITDSDNLIIKGNNLLALSSLLEKYRGKVKCIYIDPPFNSKNDSFKYNDKFTRSTWLAFMRIRLVLARQALSNDGSIFVHIDENQSHYLKVLLDEIFGEDNFMNEIVWRYRTYIGQVKDFYPKKHDLIYWYKKNERPYFNSTNVGNIEDTPDYDRWKNFLNENGEIVYGNHPASDSRFTAYLRKYIKQYGEPNIGDVIYKNCGYVVDDVWEDIIALDAKNKTERIEDFSGSGQKPEALLERIINSVTKEGDLVLDFHLGSGTTAAVAHKMNRRYIGVEQMDYSETISCERLKKVIAGEQGGISKSQNWQGGGSFIYCELAKLNQNFVDKIQACKTDEEIKSVIEEILKSDFISSKVKPSDINTNAKDYSELTFEEKQQLAMALLDKNQLYVNFSERKDPDMKLSENDIKFTESFYGAKK